MKITNLKKGTKIQVYCLGNLIEANIIEINKNEVKAKHDPIFSGNEKFEISTIIPSTDLQRPISRVTPGCFLNGVRITDF